MYNLQYVDTNTIYLYNTICEIYMNSFFFYSCLDSENIGY